MKELIKVEMKAGMSRNKYRELAEEVQECVSLMLGKYRVRVERYGGKAPYRSFPLIFIIP